MGQSASYSIIQYSLHPERFEFINVGVVIFDPYKKRVLDKTGPDFGRIRKVFGSAQKSFLDLALKGFVDRIRHEYSPEAHIDKMHGFIEKRVNAFRMTPIMPVINENLDYELDALFSGFVAEPKFKIKSERVDIKLKNKLTSAGVIDLLDKKPKAVKLDRYGINIQAQYGFKNGVYNLIEAVRFDMSEDGLAKVGKLTLEGKALSETIDKRLMVVGQFNDSSNEFFDAAYEDLASARVKLFRLDSDIPELAREIRTSIGQ